MSRAESIARSLLEIKAVKLSPNEPFTWASGMLSPIYCDNRLALSHPIVRTAIRDGFAALCAELPDFDVVAGVATAGIPHGALLADKLNKPFVYVRSSPKGHGRKNMIEGEFEEGAKLVLVEDLISTGGSCLKAAEAVQEAGAEVCTVLAIFQYGFQLAVDAFAEKNLSFHTLTDYPTLIQEALRMGYVNQSDLETLNQWRENPQQWGALYAS